MFTEGSNFRSITDDIGGYTENGAAFVMGGTGGRPVRSIPPDGDAYTTVYAYVPCSDGKVYKIHGKNRTEVWTSTNYNVSPLAGISVQSTQIFVGCTDGNIRSISATTGAQIQALSTGGNAIKQRITYASGPGKIYVAPENNSVVAVQPNLSEVTWSYDLGATTNAAPYYYYGTNPGILFCPAGNYLRCLQDDGTSASLQWTYETTNTILTDPTGLSDVIYFSSDDKRNFAIDRYSGTNLSGWPSAVLTGQNQSRIVADNQTSSIYFGGGDGKIYRYPKQ